MDSLGRRVYGVDERTYERDLRDYFDKNFEDRKRPTHPPRQNSSSPKQEPGTIVKKASDIAEGGITILGQLTTVVRFLIMGVSFYMLFVAGRKIMEELEKSSSENDQESEGDVFDKMFGSEFKGKFKNARQNKGVYKKRQEELRLINLKDDSNTISPTDVRKLFSHDSLILQGLQTLMRCSEEQYQTGELIQTIGNCPSGITLFRVTYRGYTLRELLSPKTLKYDLLKEAASYLISCLSISS
jgi:hypothetical protein